MENELTAELMKWQAQLLQASQTISNMVLLAGELERAGSAVEEQGAVRSMIADLGDIREDQRDAVTIPATVVDALFQIHPYKDVQ